MSIIERGIIRGSNIALSNAISLPEGTEVIVQIEPVHRSESEKSYLNKSEIMRDWFGIWRDRTDIGDSAEWVRKERDRWNRRLEHNR